MKRWQRTALSIALGLLVFLALFPFMGTDEQPPTHYSIFTNEVPTDNPLLAISAGILSGVLTWLLTGRGG